MGRALRLRESGLHHHVRVICNNWEFRFTEKSDYQALFNILVHYKEKYGFKLYNYVIMSNHYHLYIETTQGGTISQIMHSVNTCFSRWYNNRHKRRGHLFHDRFQDSIIDSDAYAIGCLRYISLNPVRAKIVSKPHEYKWSGYRKYAFAEHNPLIDLHPKYIELDDNARVRQKIFRRIVENGD